MADQTLTPPPSSDHALPTTDKDDSPQPQIQFEAAVTDFPVEAETEQPQPVPIELGSITTKFASVTVVEKSEPLPPPPPSAAVVEENTSVQTEDAFVAESVPSNTVDEKKVPHSLISFKEESNIVADLSTSEKKALQEIRQLVEEALNKNLFFSESTSEQESKPDEVSIWGVPLLKDDRTDVILLKFLRARDFKGKDAFTMLKNTMQWRKDFGVDSLVDENLGDDLDKVVYMQGEDRDGHPVCYNVFGEFQNKNLYQKTLSDEEKRIRFLRWRIQFLERSIRKLDFSPGGISTIFQVNDMKNSPGPAKTELRLATKRALQVLQDNYPEFVAKQVFINVPWWHLAFYTVISPFLTQRTKSKFVFASPARSAEALFKYISPELVPIQYGGLSVDYCDCNPEFDISEPVTDIIIKPSTKQTVEIIIYEKCVIVWELRVVGWEVSYSAEFVPNSEEAYTVIIQKAMKMGPTDEPVISRSFKVGELGKILLTVDNPTSKRKRLLYRFKVEPFRE